MFRAHLLGVDYQRPWYALAAPPDLNQSCMGESVTEVSRFLPFWARWSCLWALCLSASAQVSAPHLDIRAPDTNRWVRLNSSFHSNTVLALEVSTNLSSWHNIGTLHDGLFAYPDASSSDSGLTPRLYRLAAALRVATNDWKNQLAYPGEAFLSTNSPLDLKWVKFAILLNEPTRVYYQDSREYRFHYDYATQRLPPFLGMDYASFDAVSLRRTNQQVVLGAVLFPPPPTVAEYGVQFVGLDPYTPAEISRWFELVRGTIHCTNSTAAYYVPTFEQLETARTNADAFSALGIPVGAVERWIDVNPCYSPGWALGRLRYFPAAEIVAAFADGRLRPEDILLTDGVPADTPLVAGIITLSPSTPNSHTAILARSFGIPFVYLSDPADQQRVQSLASHQVILRATVAWEEVEIRVLDVEGQFDPALEAELLALKVPAPIRYSPKQPYGALWASTDTLTPADIRFFGGKAANYGLLRRAIPTNCPVAIAFSFDLWDEFLAQTLPGGSTLRTEIASRLAPYTNYPPDIVSLKTNLAAVRDLFTQTASFTAEQQAAITNALIAFFSPQRKIRFRSSTNVEDAESFTGAGLYDSYSGCLLDDLDGDSNGPSRCDAAELNERGVFRAMRKVYASFYNDDAFLERLMHRVDESAVGMGVLVHHSFPDEEELANGVATPAFAFNSYSTNVTGDLVTQLGAESVTNPDGSSLPEIVHASRYNTTYSFSIGQYSSRVPLGAHVMTWQADYRGFVELFSKVGYGFRQFYPSKNNFTLDFEYKKDVDLGLVVKQVRELPKPGTTNQTTAFLVNEPATYSVQQAEGGSVFAKHRLKSLWNLHTANLRLTPSNLVKGIYTGGTCEYIEGAGLQSLAGALSNWPNAFVSASGAVNTWTTGTGGAQRSWRLETTLTTAVTGSQPPVFTQADFPKKLSVSYAVPQPVIDYSGESSLVTNETATLELRPVLGAGAILQNRLLVRTNVAAIQTSFYWPKTPERVLIYTAPLVQFVQTRITGLTPDPIVLTNYYSQTYGPGHHNFTEEFIFEPRLEPGLPSATLNQLAAANIRLIYVFWQGGENTTFYVLGLDGKFRPL